MASEAAVNRRIASLSRHLIPAHNPEWNQTDSLDMSACSSRFDDTYHRVHGPVPIHIPTWTPAVDEPGKEFSDIIYEKAVGEGIAKITINRPEKRNAFRPQTVKELMRAFNDARDDNSIGVIIFTGKVQIRRLPKPVIAMVAGYAVGGGLRFNNRG